MRRNVPPSQREEGGVSVFLQASSSKRSEWARRPRARTFSLPLEGERKPIALVQTAFSETDGRLSPDGRWLAYTSDESGRSEVYVRPFLRPGGSHFISTTGGQQPIWRLKDGEELFYLSPERRVMSVSVDSDESTFQASVPRALFDETVGGDSYVVSRDGQRFLINTPLPEASAPIQIVVNWRPEERH